MRLPLTLFVAITACAQFPELDGTVAPEMANAPPPELVPLAALVARANTAQETTVVSTQDITTRVAGLQNRAAALRGPVIDPATRARMLRGVR